MKANSPHRALVVTSWIAAVFVAVLGGVMSYQHFTAAMNDPWKSPQLLALKAKLVFEPKNEAVQKEIRQLDQKFRQGFRSRLARDKSGAWLLLGGMTVLVVLARRAGTLTKAVPLPKPKSDASEQSIERLARARWAVAGTGLAVAGILTLIGLGHGSSLPANPAGWRVLTNAGNAGAVEVEEEPAPSDLQANWPRFRGWDGSGATGQTNFTTNVAWRSPIPAPGHSSPIVWRDRAFISGGTSAKREIFCYNVFSGDLLWQRAIEPASGGANKNVEVPEDTTYAASTMATDGWRVYAIFANGDLGAVKLDGTMVWTKHLGPLKNSYGYATSLAMAGSHLLVQLDQEETAATGSKLIAMEGATGKVLWERPRTVPASWATPIVIEAAGKTQIVTLANPLVIAYTSNDGQELWRAQLLENEVVPSPVFAGGLVFLINPGTKVIAIRPDGTGDVTRTHVAWAAEGEVPDIASPVSNGELVFSVTSMGVVTCFQATDGKQIWKQDLDTAVQASPALAGDRLFVLGKSGVLIMLGAERAFHELGRCQLADQFLASPAFAGGRIFLRGATNLFCLGADAGKMARQP